MTDDYNDYDPAEDAGFDDLPDDEAPEEKEASDAETESDEEENDDTDEESDEESDGEDEKETELPTEEVAPIRIKAPQKQKVDPVAKFSNTHREVIIVAPEERRTSNIMQLPELTAAISIRAQNMENFSPSYVKDEKSSDSVKRAITELYSGNCPLKLRRIVGWGPNGEKICEEWSVREMTLPPIS